MSCSSKMSLSASALPFVPQEILLQILTKIPAKSLVRFKCVSKFFSSLLDDHPFFPPRPDDGVNTSDYYTMNYSEENQGELQANRLRYLDGDHDDRSQKLYLAVNGLLCFCRYSGCGDDIEIHNLSTRRHISLPTTCPDLRRDSRTRMNVCGLLGFDSISRRYKVLKSVQLTDHGDRHISVKHWVFTLGVDKSWREIHSSPSFHPYNCFKTHFYFRTSVHIDGVIYSLNSLNSDRFDDYSFDIVAFDVRTENFKVLLTNMLCHLD